MKNIDKYRGCLIGGAAGDALGYAVEFLDDAAIFSKYGDCLLYTSPSPRDTR